MEIVYKKGNKHRKVMKISGNPYRASYQKLKERSSYPDCKFDKCKKCWEMLRWVYLYRSNRPCSMPSVGCKESYLIYASLRKHEHADIWDAKEKDEPLSIDKDYVLREGVVPNPHPVLAGNQ